MDVFGQVVHALSGLMLLMVGGLRLSQPIKNYLKNSGIKIDNEVNLLNEIRGTSAVMLCSGLIILLGIFVPELNLTSFIVALLIFLGFALGRLISIKVDGKPNKQIIQGIGAEFIFGILNIIGLIYIA